MARPLDEVMVALERLGYFLGAVESNGLAPTMTVIEVRAPVPDDVVMDAGAVVAVVDDDAADLRPRVNDRQSRDLGVLRPVQVNRVISGGLGRAVPGALLDRPVHDVNLLLPVRRPDAAGSLRRGPSVESLARRRVGVAGLLIIRHRVSAEVQRHAVPRDVERRRVRLDVLCHDVSGVRLVEDVRRSLHDPRDEDGVLEPLGRKAPVLAAHDLHPLVDRHQLVVIRGVGLEVPEVVEVLEMVGVGDRRHPVVDVRHRSVRDVGLCREIAVPSEDRGVLGDIVPDSVVGDLEVVAVGLVDFRLALRAAEMHLAEDVEVDPGEHRVRRMGHAGQCHQRHSDEHD